jgi:hypothetical protein
MSSSCSFVSLIPVEFSGRCEHAVKSEMRRRAEREERKTIINIL